MQVKTVSDEDEEAEPNTFFPKAMIRSITSEQLEKSQ